MPRAPRLTAKRVSGQTMDLVPAPARRAWMEATPNRFANRCLPLLMANQSGWFVTTRYGVRATWDGGQQTRSLLVEALDDTTEPPARSHFGSGILTWQLPWLFRTDPGWNLMARGPTNWPKDGVVPLDGLVGTDWANATFTMNWMLTRPGMPVVFEPGEPICMLVPERRGDLERLDPRVADIDDADGAAYLAWSASRWAFNEGLRTGPARPLVEQWQRDYFQGSSQDAVASGHQRRRTLAPFTALSEHGTGRQRSGSASLPVAHLPTLRRWVERVRPGRVLVTADDLLPWTALLELPLRGEGEADLDPMLLAFDVEAHRADPLSRLGACDLVHLGMRTDLPRERMASVLASALELAAYVTVVVSSRAAALGTGLDLVDVIEAGARAYVVDGGSETAVAVLSRDDPVGLAVPARSAEAVALWADYPPDDVGSRSGPGSSLEQTAALRAELLPLLARHDVAGLVDAPCGDVNWMRHIDLGMLDYLGVDLSEECLAVARRALPGDRRRFVRLDLLHESLPTSDLVLCRDLLVHLSFRDALGVLAHLVASGSRWLLTTTFPGRTENVDIATGGWRPLNLRLPPFDLPEPTEVLVEGCTENGGAYADKSLALWPLAGMLG